MRHDKIRVGDKLRLTKDAQERYGMNGQAFTVSAKVCTNGYKTPWIHCVEPYDGVSVKVGQFKPSDFAGYHPDEPHRRSSLNDLFVGLP